MVAVTPERQMLPVVIGYRVLGPILRRSAKVAAARIILGPLPVDPVRAPQMLRVGREHVAEGVVVRRPEVVGRSAHDHPDAPGVRRDLPALVRPERGPERRSATTSSNRHDRDAVRGARQLLLHGLPHAILAAAPVAVQGAVDDGRRPAGAERLVRAAVPQGPVALHSAALRRHLILQWRARTWGASLARGPPGKTVVLGLDVLAGARNRPTLRTRSLAGPHQRGRLEHQVQVVDGVVLLHAAIDLLVGHFPVREGPEQALDALERPPLGLAVVLALLEHRLDLGIGRVRPHVAGAVGVASRAGLAGRDAGGALQALLHGVTLGLLLAVRGYLGRTSLALLLRLRGHLLAGALGPLELLELLIEVSRSPPQVHFVVLAREVVTEPVDTR
mmetsp:Transcript_38658/g.99929  ORF Transcript_38658/g.99929 Transcript_38658/m.99929 type:complete len:389 (+) Transcript_38658:726-1892(+)